MTFINLFNERWILKIKLLTFEVNNKLHSLIYVIQEFFLAFFFPKKLKFNYMWDNWMFD